MYSEEEKESMEVDDKMEQPDLFLAVYYMWYLYIFYQVHILFYHIFKLVRDIKQTTRACWLKSKAALGSEFKSLGCFESPKLAGN